MPKVFYPIPGIKDSVQRPVVLDIVRQMLVWTDLPESTNVLFPGDLEKASQHGSTISKEAEFNSLGTDSQWKINVNEETQEGRILSTDPYYDDNIHVFYDGKLGVYLRPNYTPVTVIVSVAGRFTDKDIATRWIETIRNRISAKRDQYVHDVSYSYMFPEECIHILKEIHRLRENVAGYGESFDTYYNANVTKKATILADMAGNNTRHAIAETQTRITGWFSIQGEPEKGSRDDNSAAWVVNFNYVFNYDRPSVCYMEYPLMIHNQLISSKYRQTAPSRRVEDKQLNYSMTSRAFAAFEATRIPSFFGLPGVSIPDFDEFVPRQIIPDTLRLITLLTSIDTTNPRDILSLTDFDEYVFSDEILEFLVNEAPHLNRSDRSIFNISLYRNEELMKYDRYEITPALMVRLLEDPSLRDSFHVRVAVHLNPKMMVAAAKERLRNNYVVAKDVFWSLRPELESMNIPGPALPGNIMTTKDFNAAIEYIDNRYSLNKGEDYYQFNTVMTLVIKTKQKR